MKKPLRRPVVALSVLALALTGCGGVSENIAERALEEAAEAGGEGDVDVDIDLDGEDGGGISIDSEDGTASVDIGGGELPDDWPSDVPVIDGEIITAASSETGSESFWSATIQTSTSVSAAAEQIESDLRDAGFTIGTEAQTSGGETGETALVSGERESMGVAVYVIGVDGDTTAQYTVTHQTQSAP